MPHVAAEKLIKQPGAAQQRAVIGQITEHVDNQRGEQRPALLRDRVGKQLRVIFPVRGDDIAIGYALQPIPHNDEHLNAGADDQHRHNEQTQTTHVQRQMDPWRSAHNFLSLNQQQ